jgi:hypothetical protein
MSLAPLSPDAAVLAKTFVPFAEETFLLTLTNKGIYNRAKKDYEAIAGGTEGTGSVVEGAGAITVSVVDGKLSVAFDGVQVILENNIAESRCSCPSKTTCKHVLMALFAVVDAAGTAGLGTMNAGVVPGAGITTAKAADTETPDSGRADASAGYAVEPGMAAEAASEVSGCPRFAELETAVPEALKSAAGKKAWEEVVSAMQEGYAAVFSESGEMLRADIDLYGITVFFPGKDSLETAVCKCGSRDLCRHKLFAVLSRLREQGRFDPFATERGETSAPDPGLMEQARNYLVSVFEKGLISADDTDMEACRQFSLKFEGGLARLFRGIASDIENMLARNSGFRAERCFAGLSRLYNTLEVLAVSGPGKAVLPFITEARSEYRSVVQGTFLGLGAYPWITRSGFTGVTALLYHKERNTILSYTATFADFYEGTKQFTGPAGLEKLYGENRHWDGALSLKDIARSSFTLKNFRLSAEGRISSSKETHVIKRGLTCAADYEAVELPPYDPESDRYEYFGRRENRYELLRASGIEDCVYDRVTQELEFYFRTDSGGRIPAFIPYSEISASAIKYVERLAGKPGAGKPDTGKPGGASGDFLKWFVCSREKRGLIPLSALGKNGTEDFYFG